MSIRSLAALLAAALLTACASVPPAPVAELAPGGKLRAAINFGNPILALRNADGTPRGLSVDLANELGKRLGVPVELVTFNSAGNSVDAVTAARVDIGFVAIDPVRGAGMYQTAPYVVIEGAYLVKNDSPIKRNEDVDRPGNRIVVGNASAYDLYLTRELKNAKLVKAPTSPAVTDVFLAQNMEVAAGVKQQLQADAKRLPGLRLLDGRFMVINQAMGLPKGRDAWPRFTTNRSERYEARLSQVEVLESPSLFFTGMAGSRLPIAVAHGEGYANFAYRGDESKVIVAMRFTDHHGNATEAYPLNPNGSPGGLTAVTTADGRFTAMMPHAERVFRNVQMSWTSGDKGEFSPWLRIWRNARTWVG